MLRSILIAALIAGTLDLLSAFVFAAMVGTRPMGVLGFVASGLFGDQALIGSGWAVTGLAVHYAIMTAVVATYFIIAAHASTLIRHPLIAGFCYGLLLWGIMYWIVRPLRWPEMPLPTSGGIFGIAKQLFSHCVLVGIPIAVLAARSIGSPIDKRDAV